MTCDDLKRHLDNPRCQALCELMQITACHIMTLYALLDPSGQESVSIEAFVEGCMRYQGSAKSIDLAVVIHESKRIRAELLEMRGVAAALDGTLKRFRREVSSAFATSFDQSLQGSRELPANEAPVCSVSSPAVAGQPLTSKPAPASRLLL